MHPYLLSNASMTSLIPSVCGMLVYNDLVGTMVAIMVLGGIGVGWYWCIKVENGL